MARAGVLPLLAAVVLTLVKAPCMAQEAPLGAFLGCFDINHATTLAGVRERPGGPYTADTLYKCPTTCREGNFSLTIISPQLRCWCALATPNASYQLTNSACDSHGPGVAVFYQHDDAATRKCRVVPTPLTPEAMTVDYNQHNVEFTPASAGQPAQMRLQMQGSSGARVQPKCPRQMYGQFEATAKVTSAAGAVTAFYVRDSDWYDPENKGEFEEIDVEFLNANPAIPNSVWLNSYHRGLSRGERLVKPEEYQRLLNLSGSANNTNTWLTYTFTWQPSHVMWAINGVPVLKRTAGELVKWADMKGKPYERIFVSPDKPMHVSFSIWSDQSRFHFGGELDYSKSPYQSYIRELRRIACEERILANDTQPYGPAWLYVGKAAWPKPASPSPSPKPSPKPSPAPAASQSKDQSVPANSPAPGGKPVASPAAKATPPPTPAQQFPASPATAPRVNKSPAPANSASGVPPAPAVQPALSPAPTPAPAPKITTSPSPPSLATITTTSPSPGSSPKGTTSTSAAPAGTPASPSKVAGPSPPPAAAPAATAQSPAAASSPAVSLPAPPPIKAPPMPSQGATAPLPSAAPSPAQAPSPAAASRPAEGTLPAAPKPAPVAKAPVSSPTPTPVKPAAPFPPGLSPVPAPSRAIDTVTTPRPTPPAIPTQPPPPPTTTRPRATTSAPAPPPSAPVAVPLVEAPPTILPVVPPPAAPEAPSIAQAPSASVLVVPASPPTPPPQAPAPANPPTSPAAPNPGSTTSQAPPPPPPLPQAPVPSAAPVAPPAIRLTSPPAQAGPAAAIQPAIPTPQRALLPSSPNGGQALPPVTPTAWQVQPPGSGSAATPPMVPSAGQPLAPQAGTTGYSGPPQYVPQSPSQQPAGAAASGSTGGMFGLSLGGRTAGGSGSGSFSLGVQAVIPDKAGTPGSTPVNVHGQLQLQQQQATGPFSVPMQPLRSYPGIAPGPIYTGAAQPTGAPAQGTTAMTPGQAAYPGWGSSTQPQLQQQYAPQGLQGLAAGYTSGSSIVRRSRTSRRWLRQVQDSFRSARDVAKGEQEQWTEALAAAF